MRNRTSQLRRYRGEIAVAQLKPQIPAHIQEDHVAENHRFLDNGLQPVPCFRIFSL